MIFKNCPVNIVLSAYGNLFLLCGDTGWGINCNHPRTVILVWLLLLCIALDISQFFASVFLPVRTGDKWDLISCLYSTVEMWPAAMRLVWLPKNYCKKQLSEIKSGFVSCIYVYLSIYKTWTGLSAIPRLIGFHGIFLSESWRDILSANPNPQMHFSN